MGLVSAGLGLMKVAGTVMSGVTKLGTNALSFGSKFIKSGFGKLVLGAGAVACLTSDPNKEGGLFNNIKDGFHNLWEKVSGFVKEKILGVSVKTMQAGENAKNMASEYASENPGSPFSTLMAAVGNSTEAVTEAPAAQTLVTSVPEAETPAAEAPAPAGPEMAI